MEKINQVSIKIPEVDASFEDDSLFNLDCTHFQRILSGKILGLVTSKLTSNNEAMASLASSSTYFRNMLSSERTLFLFKKVFKILWKKEGEKELPFSDVLNCREVCSIWSDVDKQLKGKFIKAKEAENLMRVPCFKTTNVFDGSLEQVVKFLKHFKATHGKPKAVRSPFIWNNFTLTTINPEERLEHDDHMILEAFSTLFHKYGHFITEFKLEIAGWAFHLEDALKLQQWLTHMPNLKSLDIFDETPFYEGNMTLDEFQAKMIAPNFPQFPKLKNLEYIEFKRLRAPIFNRFIEQNHHISKIHLTQCEYEYTCFPLPFPNLISFDINIDSVEVFEKLKRSSQVQWPMVTCLAIWFYPASSSLFVPLSDIFQVIQAKFPKLDTLNLQPPKTRTAKDVDCLWKDSIKCRLDLPELLGVTLTLRDPISLDFFIENEKQVGIHLS